MRTSSTEIAAIEGLLLQTATPADALLLQAKALLDANLAENISAQQQGYQLIRQYGRKQLKAELEVVHHKLFTTSRYHAFASRIKQLFRQA